VDADCLCVNIFVCLCSSHRHNPRHFVLCSNQRPSKLAPLQQRGWHFNLLGRSISQSVRYIQTYLILFLFLSYVLSFSFSPNQLSAFRRPRGPAFFFFRSIRHNSGVWEYQQQLHLVRFFSLSFSSFPTHILRRTNFKASYALRRATCASPRTAWRGTRRETNSLPSPRCLLDQTLSLQRGIGAFPSSSSLYALDTRPTLPLHAC